eukprot:15466481-Alexandrium_andersonii.AAC.1
MAHRRCTPAAARMLLHMLLRMTAAVAAVLPSPPAGSPPRSISLSLGQCSCCCCVGHVRQRRGYSPRARTLHPLLPQLPAPGAGAGA